MSVTIKSKLTTASLSIHMIEADQHKLHLTTNKQCQFNLLHFYSHEFSSILRAMSSSHAATEHAHCQLLMSTGTSLTFVFSASNAPAHTYTFSAWQRNNFLGAPRKGSVREKIDGPHECKPTRKDSTPPPREMWRI